MTPQHGVSGYRIDFAVKHPAQPGRYILAIECDGASYHSSPTARERDRLRQQLLEHLGWRFHRIWSSDWFDNRSAEMQRILDAYQHAVAIADDEAPPDPFEEAASLPPPPPNATTARRDGPAPRVADRYDQRQLVAMVRWVESDTLLCTRDELFWETLRAVGFERAGSKITPALRAAIAVVRGRDTNPPTKPSLPPPPVHVPRRPAPEHTSSRPPASRPVTAPEPIARRATPSASELQTEAAIRIRYVAKTGYGAGTDRIINPLHFSGSLMWAWCHKRGAIRCFNITRITDWQSVDVKEWTAPATAKADAQQAARGHTL